MEAVLGLISSGQIEQAELRCRSALEKTPEDVNILALLGAILLKLKRPADAKPLLKKAIQLEPAFAKPHEDLGALYLSENDAENAARYFGEATRLDDKQASAFSGLANALAQMGSNDKAEEAHQQFLRLSPVARALAEASRHAREGNTEKAEQVCAEILKQQPENVDALRILARIATEDERYVVAEGLLKRIIKISPNHYRPFSELGQFLGERGRFPEAIEMLKRSVELQSSVANTHRMLGDYLSVVGQPADALAAYDFAIEIDPKNGSALAGRGHMLRIMGRKDDAIAAYERCIMLRPETGEAWWSLASLKGYELSNEQVASITAQLASDVPDAVSTVNFYFALARGFEGRGDFEMAWQNYVLGNDLKRQQVHYDPVQTEVQHDSIIELLSNEFIESKSQAAEPGPVPIFILGLPRSGSTLLEQILASHSQVEGAGELPYIIVMSRALGGPRSEGVQYPKALSDMTPDQLTALGKSYLYNTKIHREQDLPFFTDKLPANFTHIGLIHMVLPNAKIIDARRHPLDTCVANFRQHFAVGKNQSYDLNEFAEYYLEYVRMMDHWDAVLPGLTLKVQYEDVVQDLEGQTRRMLDHCGLDWEDACLNFYENTRPVNTVSAEQVREPIYKDSVAFWKNYESHLDEIKEILEPVLPD